MGEIGFPMNDAEAEALVVRARELEADRDRLRESLADLIACAEHYRSCPGVKGRDDVLKQSLADARAALADHGEAK